MAIQCDCLARNIDATALVYFMCVYLLPDSSSITTVPRWSAKASFSAVATPVAVVSAENVDQSAPVDKALK